MVEGKNCRSGGEEKRVSNAVETVSLPRANAEGSGATELGNGARGHLARQVCGSACEVNGGGEEDPGSEEDGEKTGKANATRHKARGELQEGHEHSQLLGVVVGRPPDQTDSHSGDGAAAAARKALDAGSQNQRRKNHNDRGYQPARKRTRRDKAFTTQKHGGAPVALASSATSTQ